MHVFILIYYNTLEDIPDGGFLAFDHVEAEVKRKSLEEDSY